MKIWKNPIITKNNIKPITKGNRRLHFTHAVHSCHPLPANRQCGLSSTCRKRTEQQT